MKRMFTIFIVILVLIPLWGDNIHSKTITNFLNSNSRAMSLGGAFSSVYDIDNSILWNPAINILAKDRKLGLDSTYSKFEIDIIPATVAALMAAIEFSKDTLELNADFWKTFGILVTYSFRGYIYSSNRYSINLKLNEDLVDYDFFDLKGPFDNTQSILSLSYQLGREFAMGMSLNYFQIHTKEEGRERGLGGSIGISYNALAVNNLSYGLIYFKFPNNMKHVREITERLFDNSVNFGMSYNRNNNYLISLDLRDINHLENPSCLETHLGLEERLLNYKNGNLYLRQGGYFLNNNIHKLVYSLGIGHKSDLTFVNRDKLFNFSFGITVNRYQTVKNNLFFSVQINF